jgi:hypothetical protein
MKKKESLAEMLEKFDPTKHGGEALPELNAVVDRRPAYEADDGPLSEEMLAIIGEVAEAQLPKGKLRIRSSLFDKDKTSR